MASSGANNPTKHDEHAEAPDGSRRRRWFRRCGAVNVGLGALALLTALALALVGAQHARTYADPGHAPAITRGIVALVTLHVVSGLLLIAGGAMLIGSARIGPRLAPWGLCAGTVGSVLLAVPWLIPLAVSALNIWVWRRFARSAVRTGDLEIA